MENKKTRIIIISVVIIIQTIIYVICGINKSYIHMDEAYSLGLASYDKVEIQDNQDFYNMWHNKEYFEDYLSVQEDEKGQFAQVYENQKNDVHPPFYYLLLRIAMGFSKGHFSKWSGIILNIIIFAFITVFMYLILNKILEKENKSKEKAIFIAFISSITLSSLTNAIYIRMYALATLNVLITTYLHIKLLKAKKIDKKLIIEIGFSAIIGSLTHYYYLFFLFAMFLIFSIKYIKQRDWKMLTIYVFTMIVAACISLAIFPYSFRHMFFGYRGQGFISKLMDIPQFFLNIMAYIEKTDKFAFNYTLLIMVIEIVVGFIYCKTRKKDKPEQKNEYFKIIFFPTVFYFLLVAVASPWIELRYIMPICSLMFTLVFYLLYNTYKRFLDEKKASIITISMIGVMLIFPLIFKIEPEVMYSDKREIVQSLSNEKNLPTLYLFNSQNNRFLDDILLFSVLDNSYIAKDLDVTIENVKKIFEEKDTSKGIIVFINEGQENDELLKVIVEATGLEKWEYMKRLNACDLYYLKPLTNAYN